MPLDIDRFAHLESPVQRWDPRFKIASLGALALAIAMIQTVPVAFLALVLAIAIMLVSALPLHFIRHGLSFVLFFLIPFFLIMPLTYPGEASFHFLGMPFSWDGLRLATLIFVKAIAIVLTTFVIFGSSRFDISMISLQSLKCPTVVVQMLLFTYRYTFVFLEEMRRMQTSMRARGFVPKSDRNTMKVYGNFVGTLLVRSFERTERVYKAMLSKGYQGEFHTLVTFVSNGHDYAKAAVVVVLIIAMMWLDMSGRFAPALEAWY